MRIARKLKFEQIVPPASASFFWKRFREPTGFPFVWHYHTELELTLIVRGRGLRFVGDSIERFSEGDLTLLPSNLPHTWSSDSGSRDAESVVVQFLPDCWGKSFSELPEMRRVQDLLRQSDRGLIFPRDSSARAVDLLSGLRTDDAPLEHLLTLLGALSSLSTVEDARPLCRAPMNATTDERIAQRLKRVLDRVHADIVELPSQAELAESVGMSPQAFSRFFRRQMGTTFVGYVNAWRIGLACRSLIETAEPVTSIAMETGFDNLSHFNRQFKRITGLTPSGYRDKAPAGSR